MTNQPTDVASWKAQASGRPLTLPSGNTALVRRPGLQSFLQQGIIPNALMGLVTKAMQRGAGKPSDDVELDRAALADLMKDPEKLNELFNLVDEITLQVVMQPPIYRIPIADAEDPVERERQPDRLYIDEVDFDDKMFIFNFAAGGAEDLASFREQTEAGMASLPTGEDMVSEAEPASVD
jgi:hypothetical protein